MKNESQAKSQLLSHARRRHDEAARCLERAIASGKPRTIAAATRNLAACVRGLAAAEDGQFAAVDVACVMRSDHE